MLPFERQNRILEILSERQAVSVEELCHTLYSSGATIRRDLHILESNGLIHRTALCTCRGERKCSVKNG